MARPTHLALLLVCATVPLGFGLSACGGDDSSKDANEKSSTTAEAPSPADDKAAIEQVLLAYGAANGAKACDYMAENEITDFGGIEKCQRAYADTKPEIFTVENIAVDGDVANAAITTASERRDYELVREGGDWRISSYPGDGLISAASAGEAASPPQATTTTEQASQNPEAVARAEITQLLNDFGAAQGSEVCDFFSDSLIEDRGGLGACQRYFKGKPALDSKIVFLKVTVPEGKEDVLPAATAAIKSGVTGNPLYIGLNETGSPLDEYGGWAITRQSD